MNAPIPPATLAGAPARALLLCQSPAWRAAVEREARLVGRHDSGQGVVLAASAEDAVQHLAGEPDYFSHLLLEPAAAGPLLDDLLSLTSGEAGPGPSLVLLGAGTVPPGAARVLATTVPVPGETGWLARALRPWRHPGAPHRGVTAASDLRNALNAGQARVMYQPLVRIADRRPCGLEALVRLAHPVWGRLAPEYFLPGMEAAGLLTELTRAVITRSFQDWTGEQLAELDLRLAVNMPLDVLMLDCAPDWLDARRAEAGLPADRVVLELTETQPVDDVQALGETVARLRARGYRIAIDDVGPASRDPDKLLAMPFTTLKFDKSVVREAADSRTARRFLQDTTRTAHDAGMVVVAEGVEDAEIWARMQALGIDCAQGYGIARPLPAVAVPLWHHAWQADAALSPRPRPAG